MIPLAGREQEDSNAGRKEFGAHSDDARLDDPYRVDNLVLIGVDNRGDVPTHLIPVDNIVSTLDQETLRRLCELRYTARARIGKAA